MTLDEVDLRIAQLRTQLRDLRKMRRGLLREPPRPRPRRLSDEQVWQIYSATALDYGALKATAAKSGYCVRHVQRILTRFQESDIWKERYQESMS